MHPGADGTGTVGLLHADFRGSFGTMRSAVAQCDHLEIVRRRRLKGLRYALVGAVGFLASIAVFLTLVAMKGDPAAVLLFAVGVATFGVAVYHTAHGLVLTVDNGWDILYDVQPLQAIDAAVGRIVFGTRTVAAKPASESAVRVLGYDEVLGEWVRDDRR